MILSLCFSAAIQMNHRTAAYSVSTTTNTHFISIAELITNQNKWLLMSYKSAENRSADN